MKCHKFSPDFCLETKRCDAATGDFHTYVGPIRSYWHSWPRLVILGGARRPPDVVL